MRSATASFLMMLIMLSVSTNVQAHDPQNYTILLFEDGPTPEGVVSGILVENDSLFIRNHDTRDNVSHRLIVDLDADGVFTGVDDYSTQWLNSSCDLNETGEKIDQNLRSGKTKILIGTHSVFQERVSMKNLSLVVVDEQQRFCVRQRFEMLQKSKEKSSYLISFL